LLRGVVAILALFAACAFAGAAATTKPALPPAPQGVLIDQDIAYLAPDRKEKLDLYLPAHRDELKPLPAVVMIHGGGWTGGDKAEPRSFNVATTLAAAGYVCASINYKLDGERWPTNLFDCKNAVRFLRRNAQKYQIDPKRIGVIGGSAGGHLALMVAYTSDVPELEPPSPYHDESDAVGAVVNLYGITNVAARRKIDSDGSAIGPPINKSALLTKLYDEDPALWRLASPVSHVSPKSPPTLIVHGTKDTTVNREQASELAEKLKAAGVEHRLIIFEGIGHTFDLKSWNRKPLPQDLRPIVIDFFDRHLKPQ
jgi:acetyl esterase/lipase